MHSPGLHRALQSFRTWVKRPSLGAVRHEGEWDDGDWATWLTHRYTLTPGGIPKGRHRRRNGTVFTRGGRAKQDLSHSDEGRGRVEKGLHCPSAFYPPGVAEYFTYLVYSSPQPYRHSVIAHVSLSKKSLRPREVKKSAQGHPADTGGRRIQTRAV